MIKLSKVSKYYQHFQVLKTCSLTINHGEIVVLIGPSGSGKSTLIKCINALEPFQEGDIFVNDMHVNHPETDLVRLRTEIGMVFQSYELFPHMSILENLILAPVKVLKQHKEQATEKAIALLERVGLKEQLKKYPQQLSGGQQQRVAIARTLAMGPKAILFDEPTSALDPEMTKEVLDVITDLGSDGMTMIVVTHAMGFARRVAHRAVFMDQGEILEDRPSAEFFSAPQTDRAQKFLALVSSQLATH